MTGYALTPAARDDILDITSYIAAEDFGAAARVRDELFKAFELLAERPGLGHRRPDLTRLPVRFWPVMARYMVVYREADPVQVLRVLSGYRDIAAILA